ncbi:hypothetical protein INR49_020191 [Caranx melampygus]|nr:hypothetical protein INR49_020191 [Caranx melampygus]
MKRWQQLLPLLCLTAALVMDTLGDRRPGTTKAGDRLLSEVKNRTEKPSQTSTTDHNQTTTTVTSPQPCRSSTELKTMLPANQNQTISSDKTERGQTPVLGNTWKFTACVAALAITTSMLIVGAIKGPSWYKQFHNYQHRRLDHEEEGDVVSTVFSGTGAYVQHQTFVFEEEDGQIEMEENEEEDEDGYFEDPYIKRDE